MTESKDSEDPEGSIDDPPDDDLEEPEEVPDSASSEASEDEDGQPEIDEAEMGDMDAIADLVGDDADDADESEDAEDGEEADSSSSSSSSSSSGRSWGRMYTKGVVKTSEAIVDEFGDAGADPVTEADVRDLELDEAFDEWMAEKTGRPEDIPPGQWVAIGTILLVGGNAVTETDLAGELMEGVDGL